MVAAVPMMEIVEQRPVFAAVWSLRLALFSAALAIVGIALHRFAGMSTPALLNIAAAALAGAVAALLLALASAVQIWRVGSSGGARTALATLVSLALIAWPALYIPAVVQLPAISDVSTDRQSPPSLEALASLRGPGANPTAYPGERFAALQAAAYPDLGSLRIDRSAEEAFELAADAVRHLRYQVVSEVPPVARSGEPGLIAAVDRTLVIGFRDDVAIRITGGERTARIDVRSASRYGEHDLGRNAARVRTIFAEIRTRLESSAPAGTGPRGARRLLPKAAKTAVPKRLKAGDRKPADRRSEPDRARPDAQRAPEPTARPR